MSEHRFPKADRDAVYRAIYGRRDVRTYRPEPVPDEVLLRVLEAAHQAPSVGFMQPWNFLLIQDRALLVAAHAHVTGVQARAAEGYEGDRRATYSALKLQGILDAPVNLVVTCDTTRGGNVLGRATMRETDVYSTCLAVQNLWLAARAEGLGVGWVSLLEQQQIREMLGIPEHVIVVAWLTLGWPVELPDSPLLERVGWRRRLTLSELIFRDRWEQPAALGAEAAQPPSGRALAPPVLAAPPEAAMARNDRLTKPPGSLGRLEAVALQVASVQGAVQPNCARKTLLLLAGDHGVVAEGVSAYQARLTARMVLQFASGAGTVNSFARQLGITLAVADLGVDHDFGGASAVIDAKIRRGTRNMVVEPAMSAEETVAAIAAGAALVPDCDLLGVGEMGIGNSTAAAALATAMLGLPPEALVGRGTGVGDGAWLRKVEVVRRAVALHEGEDPLRCLGGYEIAGLVGVIEEAARRGIPVVLDGFITGVAALIAARRDPAVLRVLIAGHRSAEPAHTAILDALGLRPLLDLGMRLGEGSGAALALSLVEAACRVQREVKTFEEAGIDEPLDPRGKN